MKIELTAKQQRMILAIVSDFLIDRRIQLRDKQWTAEEIRADTKDAEALFKVLHGPFVDTPSEPNSQA